MAKAVRADLGKPVEPWIRGLRSESKAIVQPLHRLILAAGPTLTSALKWGNPFYSGKGMVCFIMVASRHVNLGFVRGNELQDPKRLLVAGTSKTMRMLRVVSPRDIQPAVVKAFVKAAVALDRDSE
jgi:hypothetical protein